MNMKTPLLPSLSWQLKYTPDDGDLLRRFYIPALQCAVRYDRSTGYFSAGALSAASRGVEGLVRNQGRMRLIVGCTLDEPEVQAIARGQSLRDTVEASLQRAPLTAEDQDAASALELLAWMVAKGHLDVKVAIPCDHQRRPVRTDAIFHEKAGIIEDKAGNRLAFNGSINETVFGWKHNFQPGMPQPIRVTTDPNYFDAHPESTELWSPGCPVFPEPELASTAMPVDKSDFERVLRQ